MTRFPHTTTLKVPNDKQQLKDTLEVLASMKKLFAGTIVTSQKDQKVTTFTIVCNTAIAVFSLGSFLLMLSLSRKPK